MFHGADRRDDLPFRSSGTGFLSLTISPFTILLCVLVLLRCASPAHAESAPAGEVVPGGTSAPAQVPEQPPSSPAATETPAPQETGKETAPAASGGEPSTAPSPAKSEGQPETQQTFLDTIHKGITRGVLGTASWVDSFFYDPRHAVEENKTRLILRFDAFNEQGMPTDYSTHVQIKLRLPQLKNKAHIIISGDPQDEGEETATGKGAVPARNDINKDLTQPRQTSTSIGYFFKSNERRNVNARVGVRYRHGDLVVFLRNHYRVLYPLDGWSVRFTQEFPWWSDNGWESLTAFDLERQFRNGFFFRTSVIGHWYDNAHGYFYTLSAALVQPLSPRRALSYEWTNNFATRPTNKLTDIVLSVRYRQRLWKDWLYAEIAPQVRYSRDQNFHDIPGIWFRLELQFGWPFKP